jgi:diadenosine tetraphosphate (Ap4A) HIT family hydrolase
MTFELHSNLSKKDFIIDLPLNRVLLEDEFHYPWLLLVPRRFNTSRIMDLDQIDQLQLLKELDIAQHILWNLFELTQLNVAAIGNKTPQLHIHIIGRTNNDPAWPNTVWDHPKRLVYSREQKEAVIYRLQSAFAKE